MKKVYLGICVSHGASASLMVDGKVIFAYQEERFNKIKNFVGYPKKSVSKCLEYVQKNNLIIDEAGFTTVNLPVFPYKYPLDNYFSIEDWIDYYSKNFYSPNKKISSVINKIKKIKKIKKIDTYLNYSKFKRKDYFYNYKLFRAEQKKFLLDQSKGAIKKISFLDHHTCHAYYAAFAPEIKQKQNIGIITLDSEGDGINQTFWIFDRKKNILKKVNQSSECDIARIYRFITLILKMKPNEHEFKVMGLAPYAKHEYSIKVYDEVFKDILKVSNCKIVHNNRPKDLYEYLYKKTKKFRFDNIAAAVQIMTEDLSSKLIKMISKRYRLSYFSLSGGVSMNIKMNGVLAKLDCVKKIFVPPTGTDESLSLGACYYLNRKSKNYFLKNIYLGQKLNNFEIDEKFLRKKINKKFVIQKNINHSEIAKLINNGEIIAVVRGREEFGARSLGNRSILANPYKDGIVQKINDQIKNRDFWMPFALTIMEKHHKKFIQNTKSVSSDFMTVGFDTVEKNYHLIKNGTHQYDQTVRPQILKKDFNEKFYSLIDCFHKLSNVPALLNTSLNLHGYPISSKIDDILFTFNNSGLKYLYIDDNFLIKK